MASIIRYFGKVRIRHKASGLYLCATADQYATDWAEPHQTAVVLKPDTRDANLDWVIRPPCGMDFIKPVGSEFIPSEGSLASTENVVRFYSQTQDRHLHSHDDRAAPFVPRDDRRCEVTLFALEHGVGDVNDNWQLQLVPGKADEPLVVLRHFKTNRFLSNDGHPEITLKSGASAQAVWTEDEVSQDSYWSLEPQVELSHSFVPDVVARFTSDQTEIVLHSLAEVDEWLAQISRLYDPITNSARRYGILTVSQAIAESILPLREFASDLKRLDTIVDYQLRLTAFRDAVIKVFSERKFPTPDTPVFHFMESLVKENPLQAMEVLPSILGIDLGYINESSITALFKLLTFQRFGLSNSNPDWKKAFNEIESSRQKVDVQVAAAENTLAALTASAGDLFKVSKTNQERLAKDMEADLVRIADSFRSEKISDAPGDYWKNKRLRHKKYIFRLSIAFGISLVILGGGLVTAFAWLWTTYSSLPTADYIAHITIPIAAVASLLIWGIKTISRNLISQIHLEADAHERETMLLTFRALLQDTKKPLGDKEKEVIVSIIFRPGGNGLGDENSGPSWVWDHLFKKSD